jgi:hypothetical protein
MYKNFIAKILYFLNLGVAADHIKENTHLLTDYVLNFNFRKKNILNNRSYCSIHARGRCQLCKGSVNKHRIKLTDRGMGKSIYELHGKIK